MSVKRQLRDFEQLVKAIKSSTVAIKDEDSVAKEQRIQRLLNHWPSFLKYYFPKWASSDFASFHIRGGDAVLAFTAPKNIFAWQIARNMSKTTFWQMFAIYLNCRAIRGLSPGYRSCLWWSKTFDQASEMIRAIRLQFEYNEALKSDYGDFKTVSVWADDKFVTSQGISWRALGKGQSPRGTKEEERRPELIVGDDFDDDEEVLNENRLQKSFEWIMGALFPTMDVSSHSLFVALNNKIAEKSLMARLYDLADYKETVNLLDESGKPTWNRFTLEQCHYMISKMGPHLAQREYFNNPLQQGKVFKTEWLQEKPMNDLSQYSALIAYLDPSFKSKKNADHKALGLLGLCKGEFHLIKVYCAQATVEEMIEWHYELDKFVRARRGVCEFWMEEVFLQSLLYKDFADAARRKGYPIGVHGDTRQKPDKDARISAISGFFERGQFYFNSLEHDNHHMATLKSQLLLFAPGNTGIKKDGPDMLEGGLIKLMEKIQTSAPPAWGFRNKSKNLY